MVTWQPRPVSLALHERGHHRDRRPHPRAEIHDRGSHPGGGAAGIAGHGHQPGARLHERVVPGVLPQRALAPVGRDRNVDYRRIVRLDALISDSQPVGGTVAQRLDHHVGFGRQPACAVTVAPILQIQDHAALVSVHDLEERALPADEGRSPLPRGIASGGLDLDHVRPQIAQDLPGEGSRQILGKVQHADSGEGDGGGIRANGFAGLPRALFVPALSGRDSRLGVDPGFGGRSLGCRVPGRVPIRHPGAVSPEGWQAAASVPAMAEDGAGADSSKE